MGLLTLLHLRRPNPWERPTLLDNLLSSPLQLLITILYQIILILRGHPFRPPRGRPPIRVVCLSDTHSRIPPNLSGVEGDLLIHAGDLTDDGSRESIQRQVDWIASLKFGEKVVVAGNHDGWLDPEWRGRRRGAGVDQQQGQEGGKDEEIEWRGVRYLQDEMVTLEFKGGRRLNVYGRSGVPRCGDDSHAFQYDRENHPWRGTIPEETDVLVTHTPPRFHRDLSLGCDGLLEEVWRVKPRLHVFGHVHWGHGREAVYYDECQRAYESLMARTGRGFIYDLVPSAAWTDAFNVVWYGVSSILWKWLMLGPGTNQGGLMANVAVMYGNTGKVKNPVTVVDL
ncbi:calcineurin-like phosphoesterase [Echria macrotheca]|uniref:Calcineurin-like phosphoesterase n=1 Tax=Echria macrotheca TaxID=438768 RepID=A0AAJ0F5J6_9PEZI|nr:calcineurin-like phosphoesterase [Echria macrotheca]